MIFFMAGACLVLIVIAVIMILIGRWVYKDASEKGLPAAMWTAAAILMPGLIGLLIYIVYRADKKPMMICRSCERNIELNVSFCPYCGYQSPPVEAKAAPVKSAKGLLILILIPALLMFFSIVVAMRFIFVRSSSYGRNVSDGMSVSVASAEAGVQVPDIAAEIETAIETEAPNIPWEAWDNTSVYISGTESTYEAYIDGVYTYKKVSSDTDINMTYDIPKGANKIYISYQCQGRAELHISPNATLQPETYTNQYGDQETFATYVYSANAFKWNRVYFTLTPQEGETLFNIGFSVYAEY